MVFFIVLLPLIPSTIGAQETELPPCQEIRSEQRSWRQGGRKAWLEETKTRIDDVKIALDVLNANKGYALEELRQAPKAQYQPYRKYEEEIRRWEGENEEILKITYCFMAINRNILLYAERIEKYWKKARSSIAHLKGLAKKQPVSFLVASDDKEKPEKIAALIDAATELSWPWAFSLKHPAYGEKSNSCDIEEIIADLTNPDFQATGEDPCLIVTEYNCQLVEEKRKKFIDELNAAFNNHAEISQAVAELEKTLPQIPKKIPCQ